MPRRIQAFPRRTRITNDGVTSFPRRIHAELVHRPHVGDVRSLGIPPDHAKSPNEPVVGDIDQIPVPYPVHGEDLVRYDGDREDGFGAVEDNAESIVVVIVIVAVIVGSVSIYVTVLVGGRGAGRIGPRKCR